MSCYWAVVQTLTRSEELAAENISKAGAECYLPRYKETIVVDGEKKIQTGFLFGNYMFVKVADAWGWLLSTRGVLNVLRSSVDAPPAPVPDSVVEELRRREDRKGFIRISTREFDRGQKVLIKNGPFKGHSGLFQGSTVAERAIVLLSLLGRQTPVSVGVECLATASVA